MPEKPLISEELRGLLDVPGVGRVLLDSWISRREARAKGPLAVPAAEPPQTADPFDRSDAQATARRILAKLGF
jgi:hypothetical protein